MLGVIPVMPINPQSLVGASGLEGTIILAVLGAYIAIGVVAIIKLALWKP